MFSRHSYTLFSFWILLWVFAFFAFIKPSLLQEVPNGSLGLLAKICEKKLVSLLLWIGFSIILGHMHLFVTWYLTPWSVWVWIRIKSMKPYYYRSPYIICDPLSHMWYWSLIILLYFFIEINKERTKEKLVDYTKIWFLVDEFESLTMLKIMCFWGVLKEIIFDAVELERLWFWRFGTKLSLPRQQFEEGELKIHLPKGCIWKL